MNSEGPRFLPLLLPPPKCCNYSHGPPPTCISCLSSQRGEAEAGGLLGGQHQPRGHSKFLTGLGRSVRPSPKPPQPRRKQTSYFKHVKFNSDNFILRDVKETVAFSNFLTMENLVGINSVSLWHLPPCPRGARVRYTPLSERQKDSCQTRKSKY